MKSINPFRKHESYLEHEIDFDNYDYSYVFGKNVKPFFIPYSESGQTLLVKSVDGIPQPDYSRMELVSSHKTFYEVHGDYGVSYYPFNPTREDKKL